MSALIEAIHRQHELLRRTTRPTFSDPSCLLCVEAARKAERTRPAWLRGLTAKDMTRGLSAERTDEVRA